MIHVAFKPYHVYSFNRCPILAHQNVDFSPTYGNLLRKHVLAIAEAFRKDPEGNTEREFLDAWDADWVPAQPVLGRYDPDKKRDMATAAVRKLAMVFSKFAAAHDQPAKLPIKVGDYHRELLGHFDGPTGKFSLTAEIPLDIVLGSGQLLTLGVHGSGKHNPYYTPLAMSAFWATIVWDGPHRKLDMAREYRLVNLQTKQSEEFRETLTDYLRGMAYVLLQDTINGKYNVTCSNCDLCDHKYYIGGDNGRQANKAEGNHSWYRGSTIDIRRLEPSSGETN